MANLGKKSSFGIAGTDSVSELAPAKLNLGLRISGRRDDGYHEIDSLFVPLDLSDSVRVALTQGTGLEIDFQLVDSAGSARAVSAPGDATNLAAEAARRFLEASDWQGCARVELEKSIPVAAGLGGGSSDAAAVLRALERLLPGRLPSGEVQRLALRLGADVPYFLDPRPARVTGIGEEVEPLRGLPRFWVVLVNPGVALPTAEVYAAWDALGTTLTPTEAGSTMRALAGLNPDSEEFVSRLNEVLINDLEPAAVRLCPVIGRLKSQLDECGARATAMSGSGATVYGVFSDERSAVQAFEKAGFEDPIWSRVARVEEEAVSGASPNR